MKAILYSRFSPRQNHESSEANDTQTEACRKWCAEAGIEIGGEYEDRAMSGTDPNRPGQIDAVNALKRGDVLVVYRLDRLARDVMLSLCIEKEVKEKGARIVSLADEGTWNDSLEDGLMRKIIMCFREYECRVKALRTSHAMLRHQASGRRMSSKPPYGFEVDPEDSSLLKQVPGEMEIIGQILEWHETGFGLRKIARCLEESGHPCRGKTKWHHGLISAILKRADRLEG